MFDTEHGALIRGRRASFFRIAFDQDQGARRFPSNSRARSRLAYPYDLAWFQSSAADCRTAYRLSVFAGSAIRAAGGPDDVGTTMGISSLHIAAPRDQDLADNTIRSITEIVRCEICDLAREADHRIANHLAMLAGYVELK